MLRTVVPTERFTISNSYSATPGLDFDWLLQQADESSSKNHRLNMQIVSFDW